MSGRSLPEEVVIEILIRFPAKDLIRSRCVCKAWLKLLTVDPHFHKLHLHYLTNNHPKHNPSIMRVQLQNFYFTATESDEAPTVEIQCPFDRCYPTSHGIFGISNGLVCLANPSLPHISVWNPLTNDHITISCPPIPTPRRISITYGFGFCQVTSQFKIIRILSWKFQPDVSVYTLGTNSWRTLGSIPYRINLSRPGTALVNNSLHWFPALDESIVSFNMKEEIFQEVPHPTGIDRRYPNHVTIRELGGLLCIFCATAKQCIQIWVMKEYGNLDSWTKQFKIGRPEVSGEFLLLWPLGLADGGEIIIAKNARKIILYNPRTNSTRRLKKFDRDIHNAFPFIGSIVSPTLVNGVNTSPI